MKQEIIFLPVLLHMLLVFALYIQLGRVKSRARSEGQVDVKAASVNPAAWPVKVQQVNNNITNQFQTPVLFYMLAVIIYVTGTVGPVSLILAFFYVASRYLHSWYHLGRNYVPHRFRAFTVGVLMLLGLSVWQIVILGKDMI